MRFLYVVIASLTPSLAFAASESEALALNILLVVSIAALSWRGAVLSCMAGGGWIIAGVIIALFIAIPVTGWMLLMLLGTLSWGFTILAVFCFF